MYFGRDQKLKKKFVTVVKDVMYAWPFLNQNHEVQKAKKLISSPVCPPVKSFTPFTGVYIVQWLIPGAIPVHVSIRSIHFTMLGFHLISSVIENGSWE